MLRNIFYSLPPSLRYWARKVYYLPVDTYEGLMGKRHSLQPPKGIIYTGSGDYLKESYKRLKQLKEFCDLQPHSSIVDVGSGIGRIAVPLTEYLNQEGKYEGFDVVKMGVDWCKKNITRKHPNFQFQYIPLMNDLYRSDGEDPTQFTFPYPDNTFDSCVINSVFTHMVPEEVDHYMSEVSRVLKKGGKGIITFFIINETSKAQQNPENSFQFKYDFGHYKLMDEKVKSANVAYTEEYLQDTLLTAKGLKPIHRIHGFWSLGQRRHEEDDFQDVVFVEKL